MRDENDTAAFSQFFEDFCSEHKGPLKQQHPLPFRVTFSNFTEQEIEGECLDWLYQFLHTK